MTEHRRLIVGIDLGTTNCLVGYMEGDQPAVIPNRGSKMHEPKPSEPLLTYRGTVHTWHCDHMGHMNVMHYVGTFDQATWHLLATFGITREFMDASQRGMAAVEQQITYKKELYPGDTVSMYSRLLEVKDKAGRRSDRCICPCSLPPARKQQVASSRADRCVVSTKGQNCGNESLCRPPTGLVLGRREGPKQTIG